MATVNTTFGFTDNITNPLKRVQQQLKNTASGFNNIANKVFILNQATQLFSTAKSYITKLTAEVNELTSAYQFQSQVETKLETIMKQRFNSNNAEIQQMKNLASEMQQVGIYGDEMILNGMQELSTFAETSDAVKTLTPVLANLVAQQYGYGASAEQMRTSATMMGKVLAGNAGGLTRYGYVLTDVEKHIIETGTEMERANVIAQVVTNSIGNMNQALAGTTAGQIENLNNNLSDLKETTGQLLLPFTQQLKQLKLLINVNFYKTLNDAIKKVTPLINIMLAQITKVVNSIIKIADRIKSIISQLVNFISEHILQIAVVMSIVATKWIAQLTYMTIQTIASAIKMALSWAVANAPLLITVAIILGLIALAIKLGVTFQDVGRAIGKVFGAIYAVGYNAIQGLINVFLKMYNLIAESFIGQKLGMEVKELHEYKNIQENMNKGADFGAKIGNTIDTSLENFMQQLKLENAQDKNPLEKLFKFDGSGALSVSDKNKVDIADDYKDLLSQKALRNFNLKYTQLTPELTIGNINVSNDVDVTSMVNVIADQLEQSASSSLRSN